LPAKAIAIAIRGEIEPRADADLEQVDGYFELLREKLKWAVETWRSF